MAVSWGTPIPAMTRVVQMEPGPIPTLTASTPASTSFWAPPGRAVFPPINSTDGKLRFISRMGSKTALELPWAESIEMMSAPALISASVLSSVFLAMPMEAPTLNRPSSSLQASG